MPTIRSPCVQGMQQDSRSITVAEQWGCCCSHLRQLLVDDVTQALGVRVEGITTPATAAAAA